MRSRRIWLCAVAMVTLSALHDAQAAENENLRLFAERSSETGPSQTVVVYGSGVGIWNGRVQFKLGDEHLKLMLDAVEAAHFRDLPDAFGEPEQIMVRRVSVASGASSKQVVQMLDEDESAALKALTDGIFAIAEPLTKDGKTTTSLAEGLGRVASGDLVPETFHLVVHYKPRAATGTNPGFLFHVEDGRATVQQYRDGGYGDSESVALTPGLLHDLASSLAAADPNSLPANLFAPEYSEVVVQVLNHRKSLLARRFAGMKPDGMGEKQLRFERLFASLRALAEPGKKPSPR